MSFFFLPQIIMWMQIWEKISAATKTIILASICCPRKTLHSGGMQSSNSEFLPLSYNVCAFVVTKLNCPGSVVRAERFGYAFYTSTPWVWWFVLVFFFQLCSSFPSELYIIKSLSVSPQNHNQTSVPGESLHGLPYPKKGFSVLLVPS